MSFSSTSPDHGGLPSWRIALVRQCLLIILGAASVLLGASTTARAQSAVTEPLERNTERQQERESGRDGDFEAERDFERERDDGGRADESGRGEVERSIEPDQVLALDLSREAWIGARALGFRILEDEVLPGLGLRLTALSTPGGMSPSSALRKLRAADPGGTYDFNPHYATAGNASCEGIRCDGQKLVAWPLAGCPQSVRLGMLDTAVAESSPALAGTQLQQRHFGESRGSREQIEHGTAVATLLAGRIGAGFAGLLPNAKLYAADVFNYDGDHGASNALLIARGLDWLLTQDLAAINVSLAGPDNAVLHEAVRRVTARGVPVIAAAGNLGPDGPPRYPAAYAEAIAVTAVDLQGQSYPLANRGDYVDVAAPGVHIWSAGAEGHGKFFDGTSFAAPYVSAEIGLRRAAEPDLAPGELKRAFHRAEPAGAAGITLLQSRGCALREASSTH